MVVIAEISIQADEFLLGQIIADHPGLMVEIERVVPAENRVMPYIWGYGTDLDAFEDAMNESPNVKPIQYSIRTMTGHCTKSCGKILQSN